MKLSIFAFLLSILFLSIGSSTTIAQTTQEDAFFIKTLFEESLYSNPSYAALVEIIGEEGLPRHKGSEGYRTAAIRMKAYLGNMGYDTVYFQPAPVVPWNRGKKEVVHIAYPNGNIPLRALSLGGSSGTGSAGVQSQVLPVRRITQLDSMPIEQVEGKIVFFTRPFNHRFISGFHAYGSAVDQRGRGPVIAYKKGAAAVLVRSMTHLADTFPHTGASSLTENERIPALAISTVDADLLQAYLEEDPNLEVYVENHCTKGDTVYDNTVIAEIKGSEYPDEIILVGGHLDSWDVGQGAHDDGSGSAHAVASLQVLMEQGYTPKRTWRCVLFANEEYGLSGGKVYAKTSTERGEFHLAAIESDAGGFVPRGFTCVAKDTLTVTYLRALKQFWDVLEPYDLYIKPGGSGADISRLKPQGGILIGLRPDSQRYFDYHHTAKDVLSAVHKRELALGGASISALVYLIDKYGLDGTPR